MAGITISHVLADCLDALGGGESLEDCLDRHPRHRQQLRPLLEMAQVLGTAPATAEPASEFVGRLKDELMSWQSEENRR